ncbi:hypothetical protein LCGC14_2166470 [marine sediment metagenome]|uniref:Uncharacterized protein n=1 Tax=marine sediment metagenome TaxID=412755 RepID=A0A0F9EDL2_9ZZZZ
MHVTPAGRVKLNKTEQGKIRTASILLSTIASNNDHPDATAAKRAVTDISIVLDAQKPKAPPVPPTAPDADPPSTDARPPADS